MPNEKFILVVRELHLGYIKETFRKGAVIEHDIAAGRLIVDGRRFDDTRDLDILRRHDFVVPFSEEALAEIRASKGGPQLPKPKSKPGENMKIVTSDEDSHDTIDISDTQISKRNQEKKEAERAAYKQRDRDGKMEVVKGDESAEERIARLKGKNDLAAMAERVRLKRGRADMPIVQDDSLGSTGGSKAVALNAGQSLPSREEVEAKTESAKAAAEARKRDANQRRAASGVPVPSETTGEASEGAKKPTVVVRDQTDQFQTPVEHARDIVKDVTKVSGGAQEGLGESEGAVDAVLAENEALRQENASLKASQSGIMERLAALEAGKGKAQP